MSNAPNQAARGPGAQVQLASCRHKSVELSHGWFCLGLSCAPALLLPHRFHEGRRTTAYYPIYGWVTQMFRNPKLAQEISSWRGRISDDDMMRVGLQKGSKPMLYFCHPLPASPVSCCCARALRAAH